MTDHKRKWDVRQELGMTCINTIIKEYQDKWIAYLERKPENQILKQLFQDVLQKMGQLQSFYPEQAKSGNHADVDDNREGKSVSVLN
jgi:hypothetical protein